MDKTFSPSTHAEHKEVSADMLDGTKDLDKFTVKIIGEGISNKTKDLENIRCTLVWLHFLGLSFHLGNFADRGRYESLVPCPFSVFFEMIVTKLGEFPNFAECIGNLIPNKNKVIQFLRERNWTTVDMESHQWFTDKWNRICYGD